MEIQKETRFIVWSIGLIGALAVIMAFIAQSGQSDAHRATVSHSPMATQERAVPTGVVTETTVIVEPGAWPGVFISGECRYQAMGPAGFDAALSDGLQGQSLAMNGFAPPPNYRRALECLEAVLGTTPTMENLLTMLEERVRALGQMPSAH